ncbi:MAG TPA: hypothetical protein PKV67_01190 [Hyphomonas sp.]|nr:hypothetical protein [Hyphomonas sp.]
MTPTADLIDRMSRLASRREQEGIYTDAALVSECAARLAKAERALEEANDWRPMESAPRDGTEILAAIEVHNTTGRKWWERHVISFDECRNEIGLDYDHGWSWEDYIRWRPLPSPPKEGE